MCFFIQITLYAEQFVVDGYLLSPLMKAASEKNISEVEKLIKAGEDVNDVTGREWPHGGKPVLRYAIDSGCCELVHILLAAGACPNEFTVSPVITNDKQSNVRNLSLLSHAINSLVPISIIKELLKYGAHIDGTPKIMGDWTSLMIAAYRGYTQAVEILLAFGVTVKDVNNQDHKTALDYAREQKHMDIVKMLQEHTKT